MACSERRFARPDHSLHERLPFSIVSLSHSLSTVFKEMILADLEANGDKSCRESSSTLLSDILRDVCHKGVAVYLVRSGVNSAKHLCWRQLAQGPQLVSILDDVEELCDWCFYDCKSLTRVTFGASSSLKRIGNRAFSESGLREIHIPDNVEELCEACFALYSKYLRLHKRLARVTFGESSQLKLIGKKAFRGSDLREIHVPDSVEELSVACFYRCWSLVRVTFGESASLKRIGNEAFRESCLREIHIPDRVEEL